MQSCAHGIDERDAVGFHQCRCFISFWGCAEYQHQCLRERWDLGRDCPDPPWLFITGAAAPLAALGLRLRGRMRSDDDCARNEQMLELRSFARGSYERL